MQYAYPWYVMFGLMLGAGIAIWFICQLGDLGLQRLLDIMAARRDRRSDRGA